VEIVLTTLGAFLGALLSLLATIFIEYQKKPKLNFEIESPPLDEEGGPEKHFGDSRILRVRVSNKPMPELLRWLDRSAAFHCTGNVQFHHENGAAVFSHPMVIRWSDSEEPYSAQAMQVGKIPVILKSPDLTKYFAAAWRDLFPGHYKFMDVAARYGEEDDCFGLSIDSYWSENRSPDFKLSKGRYLVTVTIHSSGNNVSHFFALENSVSRKDFRLTSASKREADMLRS
jgi:hypothetical protein